MIERITPEPASKQDSGVFTGNVLPAVWAEWATTVVANCSLHLARTAVEAREAVDLIAYTIQGTTEAIFREPLRRET
ncbi:unnamed protein product, partial [marine sediment metagenome]